MTNRTEGNPNTDYLLRVTSNISSALVRPFDRAPIDRRNPEAHMYGFYLGSILGVVFNDLYDHMARQSGLYQAARQDPRVRKSFRRGISEIHQQTADVLAPAAAPEANIKKIFKHNLEGNIGKIFRAYDRSHVAIAVPEAALTPAQAYDSGRTLGEVSSQGPLWLHQFWSLVRQSTQSAETRIYFANGIKATAELEIERVRNELGIRFNKKQLHAWREQYYNKYVVTSYLMQYQQAQTR